jgi:lipoprotein-anchoring transpeptidase ErfK/SrfK
MQRLGVVAALLAGAFHVGSAAADPLPLNPHYYGGTARLASPARALPASQAVEPSAPPVRLADNRYAAPPQYGGGFIEFLFGGGLGRPPAQQRYLTQPDYQPMVYARGEPAEMADARRQMDPQYLRQVVEYEGPHAPGTIIIDTPRRFLFLVQSGGTALRYGIGVGRPGFTWAGVKTVSAKREWPDWRPPDEMLRRRPDLPTYMAGGPDNPLGARALYLGSSLYRIHGSNEPWTIGTAVSSGCIRMRNEDVVDLYDRVKVGTKVVVL